MIKYKDIYKVCKLKDQNGKSKNPDDTYILCKNKAHIYRFNADTLAIQFNSNKYASNRIKELEEINVYLKPFQIGDNEQTYTFLESDLSNVADVCKARKKKVLSEEAKEKLRNRMMELHSKKDS